jgi:hypothetical protein
VKVHQELETLAQPVLQGMAVEVEVVVAHSDASEAFRVSVSVC